MPGVGVVMGENLSRSRLNRIISIILIATLLLVLFYPVLRWLVAEWLGNDYYSHGPLVPLVSGFFAWRLWVKRPTETEAGGGHTVWGMAPTLLGTGTYLYALSQRAYFIAALAVIVVLAGLLWYLKGPNTLKRFAFPILFLVFMIPLPFVEPLSVPLAQITGNISAQCIRLFGVPIAVNGAQVALPNAQLIVGAQCSGLRSIVTLLTLVAVIVFMLQGPWWGKVLLALSSLPVAAAGNLLRVSSLLVVANTWGAEAGFKYYHDYSGFVFFLSALVLLLWISRVLRCREIREDIF